MDPQRPPKLPPKIELANGNVVSDVDRRLIHSCINLKYDDIQMLIDDLAEFALEPVGDVTDVDSEQVTVVFTTRIVNGDRIVLLSQKNRAFIYEVSTFSDLPVLDEGHRVTIPCPDSFEDPAGHVYLFEHAGVR